MNILTKSNLIVEKKKVPLMWLLFFTRSGKKFTFDTSVTIPLQLREMDELCECVMGEMCIMCYTAINSSITRGLITVNESCYSVISGLISDPTWCINK